ncbi:c-type cytochrome [bacterium]|jgi:cytochrome c5|nr:c-type cytochrome [bacterium]|tara:strand:+ start:28 stop:822 length:795 start_codon:yes stop_codon:yes gene_type:complete
MMSKEEDQIFFKNFSLALGFIAIMMVVFFVVAQFAASDEEADAKMRSTKVAKLTVPVGQVTPAGEEMQVVANIASASGNVGKTVYEGLCVNCHGIPAMAAMIPQTGDAAAWAARIEQDDEILYAHAINGFVGDMGMMPARGSNPNLTDDEVKAAVDYMVSQVRSAPAETVNEPVSLPITDTGKTVYEGLCVNCHGVAALASMIPQTGDAVAWSPRIKKGNDTLYDHAINGFVGDMGMMPGKGGNLKLSDDEIKAAVDYMVKQAL